jgi:hypothetical protein
MVIMATRYQNKNTTQTPLKKPLIIGGIVLLVVAGILLITELTNATHFFHTKKAVSSVIPATTNPSHTTSTGTPASDASSAPSKDTTGNTSATDPSNQGNTKQDTGTPAPTTGAAPDTPYGTFVSNHTPGAGNGAPTEESSVCLTTPGASCTITFTNSDGVVKTLPAKTADAKGAAYWDSWDVKTAGFVDGQWDITATATLNGKTAAKKDDRPLVVKL